MFTLEELQPYLNEASYKLLSQNIDKDNPASDLKAVEYISQTEDKVENYAGWTASELDLAENEQTKNRLKPFFAAFVEWDSLSAISYTNDVFIQVKANYNRAVRGLIELARTDVEFSSNSVSSINTLDY
jgi:hypothetical protein